MTHVMIKKNQVAKAAETIGHGIKKSVLLSGAWDGNYAVAVVVVDGIKPKAEVHEHAADVWRVEKGKGKFIIGGSLVLLETIREGELAADVIEGGVVFDVEEGDVIDIPPGIPHQIDATGTRLELLIVKIPCA